MSDQAARWRRVEDLCQAALERSDGGRAVFLRESCGDDEELRLEVEALLAREPSAHRFLNASVGDIAVRVISAPGLVLTGQLVNGLDVGPLLGAGGMGEVYKAHDSRLGRDVAIKVLPSAFASDPERLRRFEQEARAVAALSHPNVVVIHDVGTYDGRPYVVTEFLEGQDLRRRLADGALPQARAIELAIEIAQGLAAAHSHGIVHRDIKPENLFITSDGHLKILDFGLAKVAPRIATAEDATRTVAPQVTTEPGIVLGTAGYMSPEQVRGEIVDHRSDLFSFGVVFYEMLSGRRAFAGDSVMDAMSAVLKEEPPALLTLKPNLSPILERIVGHCLRKQPDDRFQNARDLAFALDAMSLAVSPSAASSVRAVSTPSFRKITFRRGNVLHARFTPDGQSVVYSAAWDGQPSELYMTRIDGRESRRLGVGPADVLSVSSSGELAILLRSKFQTSDLGFGTLARVPIGGGSPREILDDVSHADWGLGGDMAAVRLESDKRGVQVEFPLGEPLLKTNNVLALRVAPGGRWLALVQAQCDDNDALVVMDRQGAVRTLVQATASPRGLAWCPSGEEILFSRRSSPDQTVLSAVMLDGRMRDVFVTDGAVSLCDVSRDGRCLLRRDANRLEMRCFGAGHDAERNLSWLDGSSVVAVSEDGRTIAFMERRRGPGGVYLRDTDGSEPVRLGDGYLCDLSPDGKWVMMLDTHDPPRIVLLPTRAGMPQVIPTDGLRVCGGGFADPDQIVFDASPVGCDAKARLYTARLSGGDVRLVTEDSMGQGMGRKPAMALSPDGRSIALVRSDRRTFIYPLEGGVAHQLQGINVGEIPIQWSADGELLYVARFGELPVAVHCVNIETGERRLWRTLMPQDPTGIIGIPEVSITKNGLYYGYTCARTVSSELIVAEGLF